MVEPSDNVVCVLTFCWGPGFNSISPKTKSFILDTKNLLVWLLDFIFYQIANKALSFSLLFFKTLIVTSPFRLTKLVKKLLDLFTYPK